MSESYYRRALLSATILCLILENWRNSAVHGTSLSSVVLIARVRTLALCRTRRCHTIAYKYHGSLLWIIQLPTNITGTCRWVVNIFLTDAVAKYHLRCEIQKIWRKKQEPRSSNKILKKIGLATNTSEGASEHNDESSVLMTLCFCQHFHI